MDPVAATGGLLLLLMMLGGGAKKKRRRPTPSLPGDGDGCSIEPFQYNEAEVALRIGPAISAGMRSREMIAVMVATALWPTYPGTNQPITWPPILDDGVDTIARAEVICLWYRLLDQIDDYLDEQGIPPWPPCPEGMVVSEQLGRCVPDTDVVVTPRPSDQGDEPPLVVGRVPVGEPPESEPEEPGPIDLTLLETPQNSGYPTPGTLLQVKFGDRLLGKASEINTTQDEGGAVLRSIAYTTLLTAGYLAAKEFGGLSDPEAFEFAQMVAGDDSAGAAQRRLDYKDLIQCSPWNDALYGTFGFGPLAWQSPHGRALRFLPHHFDNRSRIAAGISPERNIVLGTVADKDSGTAFGEVGGSAGANFAYIWLPAINLEELWDSGGQTITTNGVDWEDGSNGIMPPPIVADLGVERVPDSIAWGCLGFESEII